MKKLLVLLLTLSLVLGSMGFLACDERKEPPKPTEKTGYIDVESLTLRDAEVGQTYTISLPKAVDKDKKELPDKVTVKDVDAPDGTKASVSAGKFLVPNQAGVYKVNFTCANETVADASKTFVSTDNMAPKIEASIVPKFAVLGQALKMPTFTFTDNANIKDSGVTVLKPDKTVAKVQDGYFTADVVGDWTIEAKVVDTADNETKETYTLEVAQVELRDDVIAYLSDESVALKQLRPFDNREMVLNYVKKENLPVGAPEELKGAVSVNATGFKNTFLTLNPTITDFSQYDYIGFWAYSDGATYENFSTAQSNYYNITLQPNKWQYMSFWAGAPLYNEAWTTFQTSDDITELCFGSDVTGGANIYIGEIKGGNFAADEVYATDKPYGRMNIFSHGNHRESYGYEYQTEVKEAGSDGSYQYTMKKSVKVDIRLNRPVNFAKTDDDEVITDYKIWIKNPNDKAIKVTNYTNATIIGANSGGLAAITLKYDESNAWGGFDGNFYQVAFLSIEYEDGAPLGVGQSVYIGGVHTYTAVDPQYPVDANGLAIYSKVTDVTKTVDHARINDLSEYTLPDGVEETVAFRMIVNQVGGNAYQWCPTPEIRDWSKYDYVGFWFYNGTDALLMMRAFAANPISFDMQIQKLEPKSWTFVTFDMNIYTPTSLTEVYSKDNVGNIFLKAFIQSGSPVVGDVMLALPLKGYNYSHTEENVILPFEDAVGMSFVHNFSGSALPNYFVSHERYQEKGWTVINVKTAYTINVRTQKVAFERADLDGTNYASVKIRVYNPNDFAVKVAGQEVAAKEEKLVDLTTANGAIDLSEANGPRTVINCVPSTGGSMPVEAKLYLGNMIGIPKV